MAGDALAHKSKGAQQIRTNDAKKRSNINTEFEFSALRSPSVLTKSAELVRIRIRVKTIAYENRTKSAKSGGLERNGQGERISGYDQISAVRSFCRESPPLLGLRAGSAKAQRMLVATALAEGEEPGSNPLRAFQRRGS
jgi:hypothetical protein